MLINDGVKLKRLTLSQLLDLYKNISVDNPKSLYTISVSAVVSMNTDGSRKINDVVTFAADVANKRITFTFDNKNKTVKYLDYTKPNFFDDLVRSLFYATNVMEATN
jgi:hypothetical protein